MRSRRGNILFLILLAIVLFAALSYAIMSQRDQAGGGMSREAANAAAADIDNFVVNLSAGVQRMMLVKGIPLAQVDFRDPDNYNYNGTKRDSANQNCQTNECNVFHPDGGGVISRNFASYGITEMPQPGYLGVYVANGSREYLVANFVNVGTSQSEVITTVNNIKPEICRAYNRRMGISECPNVSGSGSWTAFWGTPGVVETNLASSSVNTWSGTEINGKQSFCLCGNNPSRGMVYYAIVPR